MFPASKKPTKTSGKRLTTEPPRSPKPKTSKDEKHPSAESRRKKQAEQSAFSESDVDAVVIRTDGSLEQIKYNGSSKQANEILCGRPTIIGELQPIQTIIVRSFNQSSCGNRNETVLPAPFSKKQFNGNYLLYRVDTEGNLINLSVQQYKKYVADNMTTEQARKNFNPVEGQVIRAHSSSFNFNRLTLVYLRSEVDKKIRAEFEQKNGRKSKDAKIEQEVNNALRKMVDDLVNVSTGDRKTDAQDGSLLCGIRKIYKDENGVDLSNRDLVATLKKVQAILRMEAIAEEEAGQFVDERDWRSQLNDVLKYVRERGHLDGRALADKISETFHELNGREPSMNQLVDVFRRIKSELALEAQEDLEEQLALEGARERDHNNDGSAECLPKKLGHDLSTADGSDLVHYAFRIVKRDLLHGAKSSFVTSKGRAPTQAELKQAVEKLALKLANQALQLEATGLNEEDNDDTLEMN